MRSLGPCHVFAAVVALVLVLAGASTAQTPNSLASITTSMPAPVASVLGHDVPPLKGPAPGDFCQIASYLAGPVPAAVLGDTSTYTDNYNLGLAGPCVGGGAQFPETGIGPDITYRVQVDTTCDLNVNLDVLGAWDLSLYVVTDCNDLAGSCLGVDDAGGPGAAEDVAFTAQAGTDYFVIVDGYDGAAGAFEVTITETTAVGCGLMPTFYDDEALFESAVPSLEIEDFEEGVIGNCNTDTVSSTGDDDCFDPGDLNPGFSLSTVPMGGGLAVVGPGNYGNSSQVIGADTPLDGNELLLHDKIVTAVGIQLVTSGPPGPHPVEVFDLFGDPIVQTIVFAGDTGEMFWGLVSPRPIGRIRVVGNGVHLVLLDELRFGQPPLHYEDFTGGLGTTTASVFCGSGGAWFEEVNCPDSGGAPSPPSHATWESAIGACSAPLPVYGTGDHSAHLETSAIDISSCTTGAVLEFDYLIDFAESFRFDRARVEVTIDGNTQQVATNPNDEGNVNPSCEGEPEEISNLVADASWHHAKIPVGLGSQLVARFIGETADGMGNEGQGFLVDDVSVSCSNWIFADGFESGNTLVWSSQTP